MTFISNRNYFRIGGLATGLDTDEMVKQLMRAHRVPVDRLKQQKQLAEWMREDYRSLNKDILALQSQAFQMSLQGTYKLYQTKYDTTKLASVSGGDPGSHTVKVTQLATRAKSTSYVSLNGSGKLIDPNQTLYSQKDNFSKPLTKDTYTFSINGVSFTVDATATGDTLNSVMEKITNSAAGVSAYFDAYYQKVYLVAKTEGSAGSISFSDPDGFLLNHLYLTTTALQSSGSIAAEGKTIASNQTFSAQRDNYASPPTGYVSFQINDATFSFSNIENNSLDQVLNAINTNSSAKAKASFDPATNTIHIEPSVSGGTLYIKDTTGFLSSTLKLTTGTASGADGKIEYDGVPLTGKGNEFTFYGTTVVLSADAKVGDTTSFTVSRDTNALFDKIKSFVDKYNEIIKKINDEVFEKRERDYLPLTDEQREGMSEDQIKKWEEKARSGLLNGDSTLRNIQQRMRQAMYDKVEGVADALFDQLAEIGIRTSARYLDGGRLIFTDEHGLEDGGAYLKKQLAENPDKVIELFTKDAPSGLTDKTAIYNQTGLAGRLSDVLKQAMKDITDKAGLDVDFSQVDNSFLGKRIKDYDKRIADLERKLSEKEDYYYRQFTAMEKAIARMNQQSAWLMQQFGGSQQ